MLCGDLVLRLLDALASTGARRPLPEGCRWLRPIREADGPPHGTIWFAADGTPVGRSSRWREWAAP